MRWRCSARRADAGRPSGRAASAAAGRPRRRSAARELALVVARRACCSRCSRRWPLVLHMSSRIAPDLGDPVRTAWQVAWVGHAMLHDPLHLFDSNAFYPHPLSLAFSDSLLGYGPAAFFGSGTVAALVRYNLLFLWAWSLCFVGAYLLARELGLGRLGGAAAGAGLRLRALPRDRGRPPARDLLRRASRWRCSCCCAATAAAHAGSCSPAGWCRPGRSASASRSACSTPTCCCVLALRRARVLVARAPDAPGRPSWRPAGDARRAGR